VSRVTHQLLHSLGGVCFASQAGTGPSLQLEDLVLQVGAVCIDRVQGVLQLGLHLSVEEVDLVDQGRGTSKGFFPPAHPGFGFMLHLVHGKG
jgi:hypothetical protein